MRAASQQRTLTLPKAVDCWASITLCEMLIKFGAKVMRHVRYVTFQLAEIGVPKSLFAEFCA